ncbi:MAP kinase kinase kinase wis4 [Sphaceloma murrayae]|uniref:MAP kinase kinase kinase wis4 n=1 Tax=Sphaceloma murrayae TaxID=2082308 RepID=A0A2K1QML5_9PEZI|nr:MAP kinase kinase kinase wis4 [Sphaceloma murrayae]
MPANPVFVLVPGAWHPGAVYQPLLDELAKAGYETYAHTNRSMSEPNPEATTAEQDAVAAREVIVRYLDQAKDVVVIGHSYGGIVGSAAAQGLSKSERLASGKTSGVVGLIAIACVLKPEGPSMMEASGGQITPWVLLNNPREGLCFPDGPDYFYKPEIDPKLADELFSKLRGQAMQVMTTPLQKPAWSDPQMKGKLGYIKCLRDQAIPLEGQTAVIQGTGQEWHIAEMDTGHSPFVSRAGETAKVCLDLLKKFEAS